MNTINYPQKKYEVNMVITTSILTTIAFMLIQSQELRTITENEWGFLNYINGALLAIVAFLVVWGVKELVGAIKSNTTAVQTLTIKLTEHSGTLKAHEDRFGQVADNIHGLKTDVHEMKKTLNDHEKRLPK